MSSDAFGTPVRKYDFGKDGHAAGQAKVSGARYKMQDYLCWSRMDTLTAVAGVNVYLPFDVPPLPIGSMIRAVVMVGASGAGDVIAIAAAPDWLVGVPVPSSVMTSTVNPGQTALTLCVGVKTRNTVGWGASAGTPSGGGNSPDWGKSNRLAVYCEEASAIILDGAMVEVFIPRVYR